MQPIKVALRIDMQKASEILGGFFIFWLSADKKKRQLIYPYINNLRADHIATLIGQLIQQIIKAVFTDLSMRDIQITQIA